MKKFSVVSVDMFGTLANTDSVAASVWRTFLKGAYTDEACQQHWERANQLVFGIYDKAVQEHRHVPLQQVYTQCYTQLFREVSLDFDPGEAAQILARYHAESKPFDDAALFLESVGKHYPICLSSDTDEDMLGALRYLHSFDKVFTSEELGTFKTGAGGKFFKAVIDHYRVEPERIIHIGDSLSDVMGAREAGIFACWLNRNGKIWSHEIKPDCEVKSLAEAAALLEADPR